MHSINPLEVPEIILAIAGYLSNPGPCLAVCKAWRSLCLHYYWREAIAGIQIPDREFQSHLPFFDPICHGHHSKLVRILTVYNDFGSIDQPLDYPNLRTLCLHFPGQKVWSSLDDGDLVLRNFVSRHPLLECLDLHNTRPYITDSVCVVLVDHPRMERLIVRHTNSISGDFVPDSFWRACVRLRMLDIRGSTRWRLPNGLTLPSIRQLKLRVLKVELMAQLDIIAACPLLESLEWFGIGSREVHPAWGRLEQLATQGMWPNLQELSFDCNAKDTILSPVFASMRNATKIEIGSTSFGPLCLTALQRHASTLKHLCIPYIKDSGIICNILCTFTRLEHLEAYCIYAEDIVRGGAWACTSLRRMSATIKFRDGEDNLQPVVFEQISRLVHLEEFNCCFNWCYENARENGLRFRLQSGMASMARLSRLRHVKLDPDSQAMDVDDARWIMGYWKRLKCIRGGLGEDRGELEDLFSTNGIVIEKY